MAASIRHSVVLALATLVAAAGCTVKKTEAPPVSGPSELALSLQLQASPDTLSQDGTSASTLRINARNANGQAPPPLDLRVDISINGVIQDFGRLSTKQVSTDSSGHAELTYTAPRSVDGIDRGTVVTLLVTPIDGDFGSSLTRQVNIRLVPPGVISPPATDGPDFTIEPDSAPILSPVTVTAESDAAVARYSWSFGDGGTASGLTATHTYHRSGSFAITLTVTYSTGGTASTTKLVEITPADEPQASFVFSPSAPLINDKIFFNGASSTTTPPRRIVSYSWEFGDGSPKASGSVVSHQYSKAGTYNVTLVVTDDSGRQGVASNSVTVSEP
jgi:chitodextrinase